jgi:hypothetical protein
MSVLASAVESERRFASQPPHRQSQSLQSNHIAHQQHPLPSDHPFAAHSQSPSNSMIGPTAPAAPYDPNVYPSYPPAERHQQDYEHFIIQLSGPLTNPSGLTAPAGTNIGRPPQAGYSDNIIERMVQRDTYAHPYAATSTTNPQTLFGVGGYAMQNQNLYAATGAPNYANATTAYPGAQTSGGMYTYSDPGLLRSPDSIHSIESPSVMMQQGPARAHTIPFYPAVNLPNGSPDSEVPFSQIVARNSTSPQHSWTAAGSPPDPNYNNTGHFPAPRSTTTSAVIAPQVPAVRAIIIKIE